MGYRDRLANYAFDMLTEKRKLDIRKYYKINIFTKFVIITQASYEF